MKEMVCDRAVFLPFSSCFFFSSWPTHQLPEHQSDHHSLFLFFVKSYLIVDFIIVIIIGFSGVHKNRSIFLFCLRLFRASLIFPRTMKRPKQLEQGLRTSGALDGRSETFSNTGLPCPQECYCFLVATTLINDDEQ